MIRTWIFQGNPDRFDIDGYLEHSIGTIIWSVTEYGDQIGVGDTVYIWRAQGKKSGVAGVIAECEVIEKPKAQEDDSASKPFWLTTDELASSVGVRVKLRIRRIAKSRAVLKRDWLKEDAVLSQLLILRRATGTNFPVSPDEAERLKRLWEATGKDWTYDEVVAALYTYDTLYGKPISRGKGTTVEATAQMIGRVGTGVYNKLMNFRALDPRVPEKGLDGGSRLDAKVWAQFFDAVRQGIKSAALKEEFERLWAVESTVDRAELESEAFREEVRRLETRGLSDLLAAYHGKTSSSGQGGAGRKKAISYVFRRRADVAAITRLRANKRCEVAECTSQGFVGMDGENYSEVHHLTRLADGGEDVIENTVCVCAEHHRELHYGRERDSLMEQLKALRRMDGSQDYPM